MKFVYFIPLLIFIITPAFAYNSGFTPVYQPTTPPGGVANIHDIGNVTSIGCAVGQLLAVNGSAIWACVNAGSGEANTASSSGLGQSLVLPKVGVDLPFKGLAVSGDLTISSNLTDITIGHTGGGSGNATILDNLGDVTITSPNIFSILYYNGLNWIDQIFKIDTKTCTSGQFVSSFDNQTGDVTCSTPSGSGNATSLDDLGDVKITASAKDHILQSDGARYVNKLFKVDTLSTIPVDKFVSGFDNQTGDFTTKTFSVNTITANGGDTFVNSIDNATGQVTTKQFSVNLNTCSGTDKISAINNVTGQVVCSADQTGAGTTREESVGTWTVDRTWTNIGLTYNNVYSTGNGDPLRIDTNGKTTATFTIDWTKVGAGTQKCIVTTVTTLKDLITFTNLASGLNTNATYDIPTALENTIDNYKVMCKSTTAADDPVFLSGQVLLR